MMIPLRLFNSTARFLQSFWKDTSGVILPYVTMLIVVIVGLSLLALDGARYTSLQTQMQKAADALALAGAAELDRRLPTCPSCTDGARDRAIAAIQSLVTNGNALAGMGITAPVQVINSNIVFYESLCADSQPISCGTVSPDDTHARFVSVTVDTVTVNTIFPTPAGANNFTGGAQAVAGRDEDLCVYTGLFICNPWEAKGWVTADQLKANVQPSQLVTLIQTGTGVGAQSGPGNYGFVIPPSDPTTVPGVCGPGQPTTQALAQSKPPACFVQSAINLQTGNIANANDGINTRFDLYPPGSFQNCKANPLYPPATNVRKGYKQATTGPPTARWCNASPEGGTSWPPGDSSARGLPLDNGQDPTYSYLGNALWDCTTYWNVAHPTRTASRPGWCGPASTSTAGCDPTTPTNTCAARYGLYNYEIANNIVSDLSPNPVQESGAPKCATTLTPNPNRRILYTAIVNCNNYTAITGTKLNGAVQDVPVTAYGKFFITLPIRSASSPLYGELVGVIDPGTLRHDIVKLYR